jgi:hypothetical protein
MTSVVVLMRGHYDRIQRFINDMMGHYFKYQYKDKKTGEVKTGQLQTVYRPWYIGEFVVPEEAEKYLLGTIKSVASEPWSKPVKKIIGMMRRFMRLKKIDMSKVDVKNAWVMYRGNIELAVVGLKKDVKDKDGIEKV